MPGPSLVPLASFSTHRRSVPQATANTHRDLRKGGVLAACYWGARPHIVRAAADLHTCVGGGAAAFVLWAARTDEPTRICAAAVTMETTAAGEQQWQLSMSPFK